MRLQDLIACSGLHRPDSDVTVSAISKNVSSTTCELGATRGDGDRHHSVPAQKVSTGNSGEFTSTVDKLGLKVSACLPAQASSVTDDLGVVPGMGSPGRPLRGRPGDPIPCTGLRLFRYTP